MKKMNRTKLTLGHETLRVLDDRALTQVAGGGATAILVWLTGSCKSDDSKSNDSSVRGSR